ncbi:MAG: hypothetical protein U0231_04235 [Nitrospiraceae bacterium]
MEGRRTAVVLIVEDDEAMRSLLCDELWGTVTSYGKRQMVTKGSNRY